MIPYYVINAFTDVPLHGNPAGVCVLEGGLPSSEVMQGIAAENRLYETAFVSKREDGSYDLRFFSPGSEVGLCGHATLGTTFVLAQFVDPEATEFFYHTRDEDVSAIKVSEDRYALEFPLWQPEEVEIDDAALAALNGKRPAQLLATRDLIAVFDSEEEVREFVPDQEAIDALPERYLGLLITAKGEKTDFVDRSFFPKLKIPEDPVCGSAKCSLGPLWAGKTGKDNVVGRQLSQRTGTVYCHIKEDEEIVEISGNASLYLRGEINI